MFPGLLSEEQQHLIDVIWHGYLTACQWPKYFYVEAMLDKRDLDAAQVMSGLPRLGSRALTAPS